MTCRDHKWKQTEIERETVFGTIVKCLQCERCEELGFRRRGHAGVFLAMYLKPVAAPALSAQETEEGRPND